MGRMQRNKGQRGEREVAEILSRALGVDVERKLGAARDGGHDIEAGGFAVECKRAERPSLGSWWTQASENATKAGLHPMVTWRPNRGEWLAVVPLEILAELLNDSLRWNFNQTRPQGGGKDS